MDGRDEGALLERQQLAVAAPRPLREDDQRASRRWPPDSSDRSPRAGCRGRPGSCPWCGARSEDGLGEELLLGDEAILSRQVAEAAPRCRSCSGGSARRCRVPVQRDARGRGRAHGRRRGAPDCGPRPREGPGDALPRQHAMQDHRDRAHREQHAAEDPAIDRARGRAIEPCGSPLARLRALGCRRADSSRATVRAHAVHDK